MARSGFEEVAMVLGAMLENDDDLVDIIREMQEAKGRDDPFNPKQLRDKIEVIGPSIDLDELERSIDIEIVERLGMGWDYWYGLLQRFKRREGHCRPSQYHQEDGQNLGYWVVTQRANKDTLSLEKIERLNQLGFSWDPFNEKWDDNFAALERFKQREGHCRPDVTHQEDGRNVGTWVTTQRANKSKLSPEKIQRLNQLEFSWDPVAERWEASFAALERFKQREGHCCPLDKHNEDGIKLDGWVAEQRKRRAKLSHEKIERLNQLGFSWDPLDEKWEAHFAAIERFKQREGHCRVAIEHQEDGLNLGNWVSRQRTKKNTLLPEQIKRLNQLGLSWNPLAENWDVNVAALERFKQREGHCRVVATYKEDGLMLGDWVRRQRDKKDPLSPEQIERLNQLGFSWDPVAEAWAENFAALELFKKREGHCRIATKHQEDGLNVGAWVSNLRTNREKLSPEQIERLNQLGFSWDPLAEAWDTNFTALERFKQREGHCRVSNKHQEDDLNLGVWVANLRTKREKLSPEQIERLNQLGFSWDPLAEVWDANFVALERFKQREGHCRVAYKHQEDDLNVGVWVANLRTKLEKLSLEQIERLNQLGFSWDPLAEAWDTNFAALERFKQREGHCRVAATHKEDGLMLGNWVRRQRDKKAPLSPEQIKRLNQVGFSWEPRAYD